MWNEVEVDENLDVYETYDSNTNYFGKQRILRECNQI